MTNIGHGNNLFSASGSGVKEVRSRKIRSEIAPHHATDASLTQRAYPLVRYDQYRTWQQFVLSKWIGGEVSTKQEDSIGNCASSRNRRVSYTTRLPVSEI